jgi:hypothetical protein
MFLALKPVSMCFPDDHMNFNRIDKETSHDGIPVAILHFVPFPITRHGTVYLLEVTYIDFG